MGKLKLLLALLLVCVFCQSGQTNAQEVRTVVIPLGKSPSTQYYTLPGAVFIGDKSPTRSTSGSIVMPAISDFFAPVILPHGSTVTEFAVWAINPSTSIDSFAILRRFDRQASSPFDMATATIPFDAWGPTYTQFNAPGISAEVIDNVDYSYGVVLSTTDGLSVSAVRITYMSP